MFKFFGFVAQIVQLLISSVTSLVSLVVSLTQFVTNIGAYASLPVVNLVVMAIGVYIVLFVVGRKGGSS